MINVYNVRLDESTVEGLELVKRKEHLDTIDDVIRFFLKDYAAYNQDEEMQNLMEVKEGESLTCSAHHHSRGSSAGWRPITWAQGLISLKL